MLSKASYTEFQKYFPTHDELKNFIAKVAEILKGFFELFDRLRDGLAETFGSYVRQFEDASSGDA